MLRLSWIPPPPTKCSPQPHLAAKEEHIMKISCNPEKDIKLSNNPNGSRLATVSITLDNSFVVRGLSVMNGSKGIFVNMPNVSYTDQNGDKKYVDKQCCNRRLLNAHETAPRKCECQYQHR